MTRGVEWVKTPLLHCGSRRCELESTHDPEDSLPAGESRNGRHVSQLSFHKFFWVSLIKTLVTYLSQDLPHEAASFGYLEMQVKRCWCGVSRSIPEHFEENHDTF